jgi:hypothetical protein
MNFILEKNQKEFEEFDKNFKTFLEKEVYPVIKVRMTDDVPSLLARLHAYAGIMPRLSKVLADAHRFVKLIEFDCLTACPEKFSKSYEVKKFVDANSADVAHVYEFVESLVSTIDKSACEIQTQIKAETSLPNRGEVTYGKA